MKYATTITPETTAKSVEELAKVTDNLGAGFVILQCPAGNGGNITFGTKAAQPAFIVPGGSAEVRLTNLRDLYVLGDGSDTLIVLVL